ncbi:hypothetical protein [Microbacterium paraoxydans]|uniref:hypothetical protein n=1 Tax=Microbacterium paraoxydans TaxID=199592 RepID=UPI0021A50C2C|nr:hypothetical protein [Microbacterium paraoxydans]MCT2222992.1 hypothetical protein [Microbacterium paraoxydans]
MGTSEDGQSDAPPVNTEVKRSNVPQPVRERIWGGSAARCVLCAKWLIDEREFWHAIPTGQIAHNVAAENGAKAPRGDSPLDSTERAAEENRPAHGPEDADLVVDLHRASESEGDRQGGFEGHREARAHRM